MPFLELHLLSEPFMFVARRQGKNLRNKNCLRKKSIGRKKVKENQFFPFVFSSLKNTQKTSNDSMMKAEKFLGIFRYHISKIYHKNKLSSLTSFRLSLFQVIKNVQFASKNTKKISKNPQSSSTTLDIG